MTSPALESTSAPRSRSLNGMLPELAILGVVLMWSSTAVTIKDMYDYMQPLAFTVTRFTLICLLAVTMMVVYHLRTGGSMRIAREDWPRLIAAGLTGYTFYQLCYILGLERTTAFATSILGSLTPIFTMVLVSFLGERSPRAAWIGVLIAFGGGVVFIAGNGNADGGSLTGNLLCMGAPFSFAIYSIISRPLVTKYPSPVFTAYTLVLGTIPICIVGSQQWREQDWGSVPGHIWLVVGYLCIFPVYIAYQFWNYGIKHRGVTTVSAYSLGIPVLGGVFAWLWLDESLGGIKLLGGALVLVGLIVMRRGRTAPKPISVS
jgi:drug/metabolite transporter (DMT)-like permease